MEQKTLKINNTIFNKLFNEGKAGGFLNFHTNEIEEEISFLDDQNILIRDFDFQTDNDGGFVVDVRNNSSEIIIQNCTFQQNLTIQGSRGNFTINNVIFEDGLNLSYDCKSITIDDCTTPFNFEYRGTVEKFEINNTNFINLILQNNLIESLYISKCKIQNDIKLLGSSYSKCHFSTIDCQKLIINPTQVISKIAVDLISTIKEILFESTKRLMVLEISSSQVDTLILSNFPVVKLVYLDKIEIVKRILISYNQTNNPEIILSNDCRINDLKVDGLLPSETSLEIDNTEFNSLEFDHFINKGNLKLNDVTLKRNSRFSIIHSNLGKAEIHNCNFKYTKLFFEKSLLNDIYASETDFPNKIFNDDYDPNGQAKLLFGQLQTVFQKQGDSVRSYEYLAREVNAYYKQLSWNRNNFFSKINLFFNWVSNDFGRNWVRGVLFSFAFGFFFFSILLISSNSFSFGRPNCKIFNLTGSFLKFMNPLRHFDTEDLFKVELELSNWSYLWDFFGRVFVAYGYYQTIQAFRKFGRR